MVFLAPGCAVDDTFDPVAALHQRSHLRAELDLLEDGADLRPEALAILEALRFGGWRAAGDLGDTPIVTFSSVPIPSTLRVWRRSECSAGSCSCPVETMNLEEYVKGVVPHEWIASWDMESLKAGALAARTYAASWVSKGGKYDCADVCDTIYTQKYLDTRNARGSQAVDETRGKVIVEGGQLVFAEYSAENSSPTAFGVDDPPCAGKAVQGHGRGMCQWGTQRWAGQGKTHEWMAMHYYPNSTVQGGTTTTPTCTPTGPEVCGDGKDNDCNPQTSDTCTTPTPSCTPIGPEVCNGKDDDCNGQVDDGDPGGGAYCTVLGKFGPCATGITHCLAGMPVCQSTYIPVPESCNKVDDDCNGQIDDVAGGCGTGCTPQPEICNGLDDDCNNQIDDGNPQGGQVCYPGGSCPVGVTICQNGNIVCQPQAQAEVCDGKDNDCNGYIDDVPGGCSGTSGCVPSGPEICDKKDNDCNGYTDDVNGGCAPGCVPSGLEVCDDRDNDCNGFTDDVPGGCNSGCIPSGAEICDGKDNDCNGRIDDTPTGCVPGCVPSGSEICDGRDNDCNGLNDDVPGGCGGGPGPTSCVPQPERCNGLDDDCDGFPDEGNPDGGDSCTIYTASLPFGGVMMCISGQLICRVDDPGTSSFTGALAPIRGAGCSAAASDAARALPAFTLLILLVFGWRRRR